jgi:hypothetical protein
MILRDGIDSGDNGVDVEGSESAFVQHVWKDFSENLKKQTFFKLISNLQQS